MGSFIGPWGVLLLLLLWTGTCLACPSVWKLGKAEGGRLRLAAEALPQAQQRDWLPHRASLCWQPAARPSTRPLSHEVAKKGRTRE